jgi:hypothetical protein
MLYSPGDMGHAVVGVEYAGGFRLQHSDTLIPFAELVFMDSFKLPDLKTKPITNLISAAQVTGN